MALINVDLPAPFGPSTATNSPWATVSETSLQIVLPPRRADARSKRTAAGRPAEDARSTAVSSRVGAGGAEAARSAADSAWLTGRLLSRARLAAPVAAATARPGRWRRRG